MDETIKEIKELFKHHTKSFAEYKNTNFYDDKIRNMIVPWIKNNVYIIKDIQKIIKKYVIDSCILSQEYYDTANINNYVNNVICEEAINKMQNNVDKEAIKNLFDGVFDCGYIPEKNHFMDIISNYEYLQIISSKKIFKELQNTYCKDIFNYVLDNKSIKTEVYNIIFDDYKFNSEQLETIFISNNYFVISQVLSRLQLQQDVKLTESHFEMMIFHNIFEPIVNLINSEYIINLEQCFRIFWNKLEKIIISQYSLHYGGDYIFSYQFNYLFPIYKAFMTKINILCKQHFNLFFKNNWMEFSNFLIKEMYIYPDNDNFKSFIMYTHNSELYDEYFAEMIVSEYHLDLACFYKKPIIVNNILNQKISITKKCFQAIFEDIPNSSYTNKPSFHLVDNVNKIIDTFVWYGYFLSKEDIMLATSKGIKLNNSYFTKNFILNENEKDKFYEYCHFDFMPKYNDNLFTDIYWLRRMCKIAKISYEYKQIKQYIKKNGIELDFVSYVYLSGNHCGGKKKHELINMYVG
jgi:hypothetical protein